MITICKWHQYLWLNLCMQCTELFSILMGRFGVIKTELNFCVQFLHFITYVTHKVVVLQVPDSSPLYGCCVLMEELLDKPSPLISMISDTQAGNSRLERCIFTTRRCYCILSRLPFFELHFGVLNRYKYLMSA